MSDFDLAAFRKAKFQQREQDVPLSGLTAAGFGGYDGEGDDATPKPVVFRVRGLTSQELAKAEQESDNSQLMAKVAERLAGSESEKVQALIDGLGLGDDTPRALTKKLMHVQMAVVSQDLKLQDVVRIADAFPTDFLELSNQIYNLTGKGKVAQVKRKPSGKTTASKPA